MTKYVLAGGADRKYPAYGQNLVAQLATTTDRPLSVLSCLFAEPREVWEEKFASRQEWFRRLLGPETSVKLAQPDEFERQIAWADVVYLHGGDDVLLAHYLDQIEHLVDLWADKVVVGTSAGANYLAERYWTCDWRQVRAGRGLVGLNVIPHFESDEYGLDDPRGPIDWSAARAELQSALGPAGLVTPLREGELVVVEV